VVGLLLRSGGWFMIFFLLGFVMLACLWAAAGAMAARMEDLQATTTPLTTAVMIPFFAVVSIQDTGTWLTGFSYFPFTSPMAMPRRLLAGNAAWWEASISAGVLLATAFAFIVIGARLYEGSLLRTASRSSLRAAWRRDVRPGSAQG
jgi:ABC-2 type transport system permease protein